MPQDTAASSGETTGAVIRTQAEWDRHLADALEQRNQAIQDAWKAFDDECDAFWQWVWNGQGVAGDSGRIAPGARHSEADA